MINLRQVHAPVFEVEVNNQYDLVYSYGYYWPLEAVALSTYLALLLGGLNCSVATSSAR